MKTKWAFSTAAAVAALLLTSCPETSIPTNFGTGVATLKSDEWEGTWLSAGSKDEDGIIFSSINAENGSFTACGTKKDDKPLTVMVRQTGGKDEQICFLTYTGKAGETRGPLRLVSLPKEGVFYLWNMRHDEVEKAITSGELKGQVVKGEIDEKKKVSDHNHSELSSDPANYPKLLEPRFWAWTKPEAFVRKVNK